MKVNMHNIDRLIRAVAALAIILAYMAGVLTGSISLVLLIVAVVFLATAIIGYCPLYTLLRIRTNKAPRE